MELIRDNEEKLREASCYGDIDAMADLIQRGVDINSTNAMNGWTALHWACQRGNSSSVDLLLRYGADPTLLNNRNQAPAQLTSLPHIKAKLGYPAPSLTPSSPTNTPIPSSPTANGASHFKQKPSHKMFPQSLACTGSPPPFPSNYIQQSPPPLLSSPPSSPSPPPHQDSSSTFSSGMLLSSASSSPPPLPTSPTQKVVNEEAGLMLNKKSNSVDVTLSPLACKNVKSISRADASRSSSLSSSDGLKNTSKDISRNTDSKHPSSDAVNGNIDPPSSKFPDIIDNNIGSHPSSFANIFSSSSTITSTVDMTPSQSIFDEKSETNKSLPSTECDRNVECESYENSVNISDSQEKDLQEEELEDDDAFGSFETSNMNGDVHEEVKPSDAFTANLISFPSSVSLNYITDSSAAISTEPKLFLESLPSIELCNATPVLSILDQDDSVAEEIQSNLIVAKSDAGNDTESNVPSDTPCAASPSKVVQESSSKDDARALAESEISHKGVISSNVDVELVKMIISQVTKNNSCCSCCEMRRESKSEEKIFTDRGTHVSSDDVQEEVTLKVRVADIEDCDFIEVELPSNTPTAAHRTYSALLQLLCNNLRVNPHHVDRIRKLPNTRLRNDGDVCRLVEGAELELVVRGLSGVHHHKNGGKPVGNGGFRKQPILY